MSRKLKKGYFVRGEFVAEGSPRDLELKRELKGSDEPSRTDLKRQSTELQKLGEDLLTLRAELLAGLDLSDKLKDAVLEAKRITNFEGKRRQLQFVGKLMRQLDPAVLEAVRHALTEQNSGSARATQLLHLTEDWRARLLSADEAVGEWLNQHPGTDAQQLRSLIRQAKKDAIPEKPGAPIRHGRAYRELYALIHDQLTATEPAGAPA